LILMLDPKTWNEELLKQYSADMRQFVGAREYTLNGQRALHLYNAVGLEFIILPDRGFDIWDARYKGIPLTWLAPGSPHPPDWGAGWLRGFNGGLLTTCGLTHVGPAETDDLTGERSDIHGNYTRLCAEYALDIKPHRVTAASVIYDTAFFNTQLKHQREYFIARDYALIHIRDRITNVGDTAAPLMLLYHFNLGFPLVHEGVKLHTVGHVCPRDTDARAGIETWDTYSAPSPNYREQVFYHQLRQSEFHNSHVLIGDNSLAIYLAWDSVVLPYFTQWKNTRQHQYINGIEPGNCIPEGRNAARKAGRLQMLQPGKAFEAQIRLTILDSPAEIAAQRAAIAELNASGELNPNCDLSDYAAPKE
jgi:hypothetical protein